MIFQEGCVDLSYNVPITGLDQLNHILVVGVLIPIVGSLILAIIFAKLFGPLYLTIKSKFFAKDFKNSYISLNSNSGIKSKLFGRMIRTILLTFGLVSSVITLIDPTQWLSPDTVCQFQERGIEISYHFEIFIALFGLILPLAMGLMAISWALEDSGLMHFSFDKNGTYEIEPINNNYSSFLDGYAGISSLMFVINFTKYSIDKNTTADGFLILVPIIIALVCFIPSYLLFVKIMKDHSYLRKGLSELKKLTESNII